MWTEPLVCVCTEVTGLGDREKKRPFVLSSWSLCPDVSFLLQLRFPRKDRKDRRYAVFWLSYRGTIDLLTFFHSTKTPLLKFWVNKKKIRIHCVLIFLKWKLVELWWIETLHWKIYTAKCCIFHLWLCLLRPSLSVWKKKTRPTDTNFNSWCKINHSDII